MENDMPAHYRPILVFALVLAAMPGAPYEARAQGAGTVTLTHVHGLAYSADGKNLYIPSHHGLAVYAGGKWSKAPGPQHDYMGFSATKDGFYSSGHPARGSGLINPFGLIRSTDGGKTLVKLSLEGEMDFHLLATSYGTNAVYVYNPAPNSKMKTPGLYYTLNNGFTWKRAQANGFNGAPTSLAVHPTDPKVVVMAAKSGFYLSTDSGDSFSAITKGAQGLAAFFDLDGDHLWLSSYAGTPALARTNLKTGAKNAAALPPLTRDAVAYIAQNPVSRNEFAIATFERSVFLSKDMGKSWTQIAQNGQAK
jgi:photosystem II stability/assembly factor-like uncharacterized protein